MKVPKLKSVQKNGCERVETQFDHEKLVCCARENLGLSVDRRKMLSEHPQGRISIELSKSQIVPNQTAGSEDWGRKEISVSQHMLSIRIWQDVNNFSHCSVLRGRRRLIEINSDKESIEILLEEGKSGS